MRPNFYFYLLCGLIICSLTAIAAPSTSRSSTYRAKASRAPASLATTSTLEDSEANPNQVLDEFNAIAEDDPDASPARDSLAREHRTAVNYNLQANREMLAPPNFHGKLGINFQAAASLKNMMDNTALDFSYGFPQSWGWIELMLTKQTTTFARIGMHEQHPSYQNASIKTKNNSLILGIGATMVSDYPQELLGNAGKNIYATASSYLTYMSYKDKDWGQTYSGPGLKVEGGFHYRLSKLLHFGLKGFYYLNILQTRTNNSNTYPKRITVAWPAFGADIGYYF